MLKVFGIVVYVMVVGTLFVLLQLVVQPLKLLFGCRIGLHDCYESNYKDWDGIKTTWYKCQKCKKEKIGESGW